MDNRPFHEVVKTRLAELGENPFSLSARAGIPYDRIRNVIRDDDRRADPKLGVVRELCQALGLDFYIGPRRESGPVEQVVLDGEPYAHIPLHDALLAAGGGAYNDNDHVVDHLAFRRDWLRRLNLTAADARLARVHGDSMQPSLWPGDMILIDTARTEIPVRTSPIKEGRRSPVYAMIDNGEARVKRIERPSADLMMLLSDNPDYAPELRQGKDLASIKIIGKVVWWGHTAKE